MNIRFAFLVMTVQVLMMGICVPTEIDGWTVVLEPGIRGIVPCPSISFHGTTMEEWRHVYWFFSGKEPENLLISYHYDEGQGDVSLHNGNSESAYSIEGACSLVIENVIHSNRGRYYFQLEPRHGDTQEGSVTVKLYDEGLTVFLERGKPGMVPCLPVKHNEVEVKESDAIYWYYKKMQQQFLLISYFLGDVGPQNEIPEGVYDIDAEFSLVIQNVTFEDEGEYFFKLKPKFSMNLITGVVTVKVYDSGWLVFLERDRRGIVPCPPITSGEVTEKETAATYWYFRRMESNFIIMSYFLGTVTTPSGIPRYVFDMNDEMSLVIQSVTESDAGDYYFKLQPRFGGIKDGIVRVIVYDRHGGLSVILERGRPGVVSSPPIASREITVDSTNAMYWYFIRIKYKPLLISYIRGEVSTQTGVPRSVYDIDAELSLVIGNVTDSDEGDYFFTLKPRHGPIKEAKVAVTVKVSPREPFPRVLECGTQSECQKEISFNDSWPHYLTCIVENAKPVVELTWWRLMENDAYELIDAEKSVEHNILQPDKTTNSDMFGLNNTFTTTSSVQVSSTNESERYRCEANGVALGDRNGSRVIVVVRTKHTSRDQASTSLMPVVLPLTMVVVAVVIIAIFFVRNKTRRQEEDRLFDNDLTLKNQGKCRDFYNHLRMISSHKVYPSRLDILTINMDDIKDNGDLFQGILELVVPTHIVYDISFPENVKQVLVVLNNVIRTLGLNYRTQYSLIRVGKGRPRQVNDYDQCLTNLKDFFQTQFKNGYRFGMTVECDIVDSHLTTLVDILTTNEAFEFDVLHQSMNGRLKCLSSLIPSLKILHLIDCGLTSDDLNDLAEFISSAKQLGGLFVSGGEFTEESINGLLAGLWHCPNIMCLRLSNTGLEPSVIRSAVRANFGVKEDESVGYNGLFYIKQGEKKKSNHVYPHFQLHKLPEIMA